MSKSAKEKTAIKQLKKSTFSNRSPDRTILSSREEIEKSINQFINNEQDLLQKHKVAVKNDQFFDEPVEKTFQFVKEETVIEEDKIAELESIFDNNKSLQDHLTQGKQEVPKEAFVNEQQSILELKEGKTVLMALGELLNKDDDEPFDDININYDQRVWTMISAKGGSGSTTLSLNLASIMARLKKRALLFDMNFQFGDLLSISELKRKKSIAQVQNFVKNGEPLKVEYFSKHQKNFSILSQVGSINDLENINLEEFAILTRELKENFDFIFFEGAIDFGDVSLSALDSADKVAIVITQELLSIKRARRMLDILEKIGLNPEHDLVVICNKYSETGEVNKETLENIFNKIKLVFINEDRELFEKALRSLKTIEEIDPSSTVYKQYLKLAQVLTGVEIPEEFYIEEEEELPFWKKIIKNIKEKLSKK